MWPGIDWRVLHRSMRYRYNLWHGWIVWRRSVHECEMLRWNLCVRKVTLCWYVCVDMRLLTRGVHCLLRKASIVRSVVIDRRLP